MLHGRRMETIALIPLEEKVIDTSNCPIAYTLSQIGGVWKSRLLWAIEFDINRFSLLLNKLTISRKSLSKELKELERNGMITRKSFPEVPPGFAASPQEAQFLRGDYQRSVPESPPALPRGFRASLREVRRPQED